jgi:serine/threonine-protein kinase
LDFLGTLSPGDRLGPYVIARKIGEGGMGVVYQAVHEQLHRAAAVKVLSPWLATELGRQRFEREVRACAALRNAHTVDIYDFGESDDGVLYYAMELLDGFDLGRLVDLDGPQSAARTIRILTQIAGALGEAHDKGLIHRDIKPPNIILCFSGGAPDVAKLVDFGLVIPIAPGRRLTIEGHVLGTPRYVAPEMLHPDADVSPATDFYALGLVAYFLLSGRHAFDGDASAAILRKQRDEPAPPLTDVMPSVALDLASVVHWCLEKDPARRPASARELREALARCADAEHWDEEEARAWWDAWSEEDRPSFPSKPPGSASPSLSVTSPERPRAKE